MSVPGLRIVRDADLRRLFSDQPQHRRKEAASTFLRRNRGEIRTMVHRIQELNSLPGGQIEEGQKLAVPRG